MKTAFPNAKVFGATRQYFDVAVSGFQAEQDRIEQEPRLAVQQKVAEEQREAAMAIEAEQRARLVILWEEFSATVQQEILDAAIADADSKFARKLLKKEIAAFRRGDATLDGSVCLRLNVLPKIAHRRDPCSGTVS